MNAFLFRHRDRILGVWAFGVLVSTWPPSGCAPSLAALIAGLSLRAWSRRHIGPHSRGREMACPEISSSGPYRFFPHPLYLANLLVASSLALALAGPTWTALLAMSLPVCLYATLAIAESRHLAKHPAPRRSAPHDATSGGWRSEWASFVPPLAAWSIVQFLSAR